MITENEMLDISLRNRDNTDVEWLLAEIQALQSVVRRDSPRMISSIGSLPLQYRTP